ncbi:hypothetical protein Zmor_008933 [Zophobas morio]|uniref:Uncharacterized protein n=1 Tax=Zophobas morio TaxID=2755281 RepID=A0AA38LZ34_9CUCU|nr:hypothetical protein Zmor_008933 [Zophobas morio]
MTSMSEREIDDARKILEAVNLLKSFRNIEENNFIFYLYAPLEPGEFFKTNFLNNMLIGRIGSDEYEKIRFLLRDLSKNTSKYTEVSASYSDVFGDEIKYPSFSTGIDFTPKKGHEKNTLSESELTYIKNKLAKSDISINIIEDSDKAMLFEVKNAFRLEMDDLIECLKKAFNFETSKISRKKLCNEALKVIEKPIQTDVFDVRSSKEMLKAHEFEKYRSETYLKGLLKAKVNTPADTKLIKDLRVMYKLHDSVINTLIDYSYFKNDKKIVANYILKIASTFAEKGINTSVDAMSYLKEAFRETKKASSFRAKQNKKQEFVSDIE